MRFQSTPNETHVQTVKMILRYLKGTLEFILWYPRSEDFNLTSCIDANWAGNVDDRKGTSEGAFILEKCLVSCLSKK